MLELKMRVLCMTRLDSELFPGWKYEYFSCSHGQLTQEPAAATRICHLCTQNPRTCIDCEMEGSVKNAICSPNLATGEIN